MNIDFHCHFLPVNFPELVHDIAHRYNPQISHGLRESKQISVGGHYVAPHTIELYDLDEKRMTMDRTDIDVQVLSTPPYALFYWADHGVAIEMDRTLNEALSSAVQDEPERFVGLASVPLRDPAAAVEELERAVTQLGMKGVAIGSSVYGCPLSSPECHPFFQKIQELDVPVFVHPTNTPMTDLLPDFYLSNHVDYPTEPAMAAAQLMFVGVLEMCPNRNICLAHGGATFPVLLGRSRQGRASDRSYMAQRPTPRWISPSASMTIA
jgi:aminocarboxymuconate-semialdehyde decarboxylase